MKLEKPYKKSKKIIPLVKRCVECKKCKVFNHHFLCDKCWGDKAKRKLFKERKKLLEHKPKKRTELERLQLRANKNLKRLD